MKSKAIYVLSDDVMKKELSKEEYEKFVDNAEKYGYQYAMNNAPSFDHGSFQSGLKTCLNTNIKALRTENGLSQNEVAAVLGISQREYWRLEQEGYCPNILVIANLAIFYNVSIDWLSGYYYENRKKFYEDMDYTVVNGYCLMDMIKAKKEGRTYEPMTLPEDITEC